MDLMCFESFKSVRTRVVSHEFDVFQSFESVQTTIATRAALLHCKNNLVVLTTEWLPWLQTNCGYESGTLVLKSNCISKPKGQLPSSSYNHNTLKTLITSSSGYMKVP